MNVFKKSEAENSHSPLGAKMEITLAHSYNQHSH